MKYFVEIDGTEHEVLIDGSSVRIGDRDVTGQLEDVEGSPLRLLKLGTAVHSVVVRRGAAKGQYTISVGGWRFDVEALDERARTIRELSAAASGPKGPAPLVAPMPGLVVRVNVQPGDQVQPGQGLVVMEAMKMENELRAVGPGTVKTVHAVAGTAVEKGTILVELE